MPEHLRKHALSANFAGLIAALSMQPFSYPERGARRGLA